VHRTRIALFSSIFLLSCSTVFAQAPEAAATPAQSTATTTASSEIKNFQKIEDTWADAVNRRDQYALELVLSPLFVDVSAAGDITTRNQQLAQVLTGEDKTLHLEQKVITVRTLGDIVVANGTYTLHHKSNTAQVDEKGVFTHVFERVHSGWVCINSQRTMLREDPSSNNKNKNKKQPSDTESPLHIPLFSK
jgi:ketosteroid isomerase-like protein